MNPETFTDKTNEIIGKAKELALDSAHVQILPVHLALALLKDEEGLAPQIFKKAGADITLAERGLKKLFVRYVKACLTPHHTTLTHQTEFQYKSPLRQMSVSVMLLCKCYAMLNRYKRNKVTPI
jgi:ATP-dependent Clp protease ATP-binding subunit ClpA